MARGGGQVSFLCSVWPQATGYNLCVAEGGKNATCVFFCIFLHFLSFGFWKVAFLRFFASWWNFDKFFMMLRGKTWVQLDATWMVKRQLLLPFITCKLQNASWRMHFTMHLDEAKKKRKFQQNFPFGSDMCTLSNCTDLEKIRRRVHHKIFRTLSNLLVTFPVQMQWCLATIHNICTWSLPSATIWNLKLAFFLYS